jgi:hypothetical protein
MAQPRNRPVGLHCLLYLVADRICTPQNPRGDSPVEHLKTSEHWLARVAGQFLDMNSFKAAHRARVPVPCRPTVQVLQMELASKLLLAALLECRDAGRVELRLAKPPSGWRTVIGPNSRALVTGLRRSVSLSDW